MASKATDSRPKFTASEDARDLVAKMNQIKKQIQAQRPIAIRDKIERNAKNLEAHTLRILSELSINDNSVAEEDTGAMNTLSWRAENPICKLSGCARGFGDKDPVSCHDYVPQSCIKLDYVERLPPYTTWIFLDRNQRMADDQSVLGRRRIYYDEEHGSEALICSDSEEEIPEPEEEKREFTEGEDQILTTILDEHGLDEEVVKDVSDYIGATATETKERYNTIVGKSLGGSGKGILLDKSLKSALDSFDNLFCRRCMVFDCRLHGSSSSVIYSTEKQFYWSEHEDDRKPCGDQCYLTLNKKNKLPEVRKGDEIRDPQTTTIFQSETTSNPEAPLSDRSSEKRKVVDDLDIIPLEVEMSYDDGQSSRKKPKKLAVPDIESGTSKYIPALDGDSGVDSCRKSQHATETREGKQPIDSKELEVSGVASNSEWRQMEKELYMKGLEIFGRNSCLIARNLLSGLKTCSEVSRYMYDGGVSVPHKSLVGSTSLMDENGKTDNDHTDQEMPTKLRLIRRRGKSRKLKYSTKSPGHPSMWKRIADGKHQCKQYTPCGCTSMCGKQCSCLLNGTCCEKYCGCSKSCKNRFRGCHCAKSQCRSRQCPCFAAGRECDPDVCRNCWVSCGDGTLDAPPRRDGQCGNMRLLLRQQQRILLAESDVAGWGAFIKNSVNKNDYLGEYTGELISHREADKRGKIYDRANSSFLFDLNEQYVLDAYRKGDKLKFANHSSNPNCYAKVMLVAGDHRVGIFAKEHIEASEELFYDYRYGPNEAPAWARKPEGSKREDTSASQGRAKKHQSH